MIEAGYVTDRPAGIVRAALAPKFYRQGDVKTLDSSYQHGWFS
jgi:hypothetical protein